MSLQTLKTAYLDLIPVAEWSEEEAYQHCLETFQRALRIHPDLIEPFIVSIDNAETNPDRLKVMRQALAKTFVRRHQS